MVSPLVLFGRVFLLVCLMAPGFILRKLKMVNGNTAKDLANIVIYVAQPALTIRAFIRDFSTETIYTMIGIFVFSLLIHGIGYAITFLVFKKDEEGKQKVLRFASMFSNNGYMGIPLIVSLLGPEAALFTSVYNIGFSIFQWSVGCLIFTKDKKYLSVKKILINPAMVPVYIGLVFFFLPINNYVPTLAIDLLEAVQSLVAPLSMIMIGIRLAEVNFKKLFFDRKLYEVSLIRLIIIPVIMWVLLIIARYTGIYNDQMAYIVLVICASTPAAAATSIFAEKFKGDALYAGQVVAFTTVLSVLTMPLVSFLLYI